MKTLAVVLTHVWERAAWSTFPDSCWSQPGSRPVPKLCLYQKTKWKLIQLSGEFDLCQQTVYIVECPFKTYFLFGRRYFPWVVQKPGVSVQGVSLCAFLERLLQIKVGIIFSFSLRGPLSWKVLFASHHLPPPKSKSETGISMCSKFYSKCPH